MKAHVAFRDIGKRMLLTWRDGVAGLRDERIYALGEWPAGKTFTAISAPPKLLLRESC